MVLEQQIGRPLMFDRGLTDRPESWAGTTIRRERLDHAVVTSERHCRRLLREYLDFYNAARPHQTLGLEPPDGPRVPARLDSRRLVGRPVLGGLHHVHEWAA